MVEEFYILVESETLCFISQITLVKLIFVGRLNPSTMVYTTGKLFHVLPQSYLEMVLSHDDVIEIVLPHNEPLSIRRR